MTWVDLSGAFSYGSKLTSTQMQNLRDNITAAFNKDSGAPVLANSYVVEAMINNTAVTESKLGSGAVTESKLGSSAVSQGKLKTSTPPGSASVLISATNTLYHTGSLPGGEYGLRGKVRVNTSQSGFSSRGYGYGPSLSSSYVSLGGAFESTTHTGWTGYIQERYITSSGEVHWIFSLRNRETGIVEKSWQAPDHICFGHGGDPEKVQHPYGDYDQDKYELVVINPPKDFVQKICRKTGNDMDFLQVIEDEYEIDDLSSPPWPKEKVTVGLPDDWDESWLSQKTVSSRKSIIPKPKNATVRVLKKKT